jgi:hypothetical protein
MEEDYRGNYAAAMEEAIRGGLGVYGDFDTERQQESFRILSSDRTKVLNFARREGLTTGKVDTIKTLKSPKTIYQIMAVGEDTKKVRSYLQRLGG